MLTNLLEITKEELLGKTQEMRFQHYRFVTASCVDLGDNQLEVTYHFDKDFEIHNVRIHVSREDVVQSISSIYFCAVLVENEMKELFGLNVQNMAIDYQGHLLLSGDERQNPMAKHQIVIEKREGK